MFSIEDISRCGAKSEFTNACENLEKNEVGFSFFFMKIIFNHLFLKIIFNQVTEFDVLGDQHLVIGNNNGTLSVWDLDTAQMTVYILCPKCNKIHTIALFFSPLF